MFILMTTRPIAPSPSWRLVILSVIFFQATFALCEAQNTLPSEATAVLRVSSKTTEQIRHAARLKLKDLQSSAASMGDLEAALLISELILLTYPKDPIVGRWRWFNGGVVDMLPDGRVVSLRSKKDTMRWNKSDLTDQKYKIAWKPSKWIDVVWLCDQQVTLRGHNQEGVHVGGVKIGTEQNQKADNRSANLSEAQLVIDELRERIDAELQKVRDRLELIKSKAVKSNDLEGALQIDRAVRALE
jgi:hypothetical protein